MVIPGKDLGTGGAALLYLANAWIISQLFFKNHRRQLEGREGWRLIIYTYIWALMVEFLSLWYLVTFPEETGVYLDQDGLTFVLGYTALMSLLFCFLSIHYACRRFIASAIKRESGATQMTD